MLGLRRETAAYLAVETSFWFSLFKLVLARQDPSSLYEIDKHFMTPKISLPLIVIATVELSRQESRTYDRVECIEGNVEGLEAREQLTRHIACDRVVLRNRQQEDKEVSIQRLPPFGTYEI